LDGLLIVVAPCVALHCFSDGIGTPLARICYLFNKAKTLQLTVIFNRVEVHVFPSSGEVGETNGMTNSDT